MDKQDRQDGDVHFDEVLSPQQPKEASGKKRVLVWPQRRNRGPGSFSSICIPPQNFE